MADPMLTGLLNQTAGGNFWQGSGAPTTGYGSFSPAPPSPQESAPQPPEAQEAAQQPQQPGWTTEDKQQFVAGNAGQMNQMLQRELAQLRAAQASYPPGSPRWQKFQMQIQQMQARMQEQNARIGGIR